MPWIKATRNFTFRFTHNFMTDYKQGCEYRVTTRCALSAIAAGHAVLTDYEIKRRKELERDDRSGRSEQEG